MEELTGWQKVGCAEVSYLFRQCCLIVLCCDTDRQAATPTHVPPSSVWVVLLPFHFLPYLSPRGVAFPHLFMWCFAPPPLPLWAVLLSPLPPSPPSPPSPPLSLSLPTLGFCCLPPSPFLSSAPKERKTAAPPKRRKRRRRRRNRATTQKGKRSTTQNERGASSSQKK